MGTISGGQLRVTVDDSGHLLPCLEACPPILVSRLLNNLLPQWHYLKGSEVGAQLLLVETVTNRPLKATPSPSRPAVVLQSVG